MTGETCEFPLDNASNDEIDALLARARTIAVVGVSAKPDRDSHRVAAYLQAAGYRIVPVNPGLDAVLGERAWPDLASIPPDVAIDIVDIFRRPEEIPPIVEAAIDRGVQAVWMQRGLAHNQAAARARQAGLTVVMDRCLKVEHTRWAAARP
jgi:hypothetical protein